MIGRIVELARFGGPDVFEYKQSPVADPGPGALLVEVHAAGVNYLDLVARAGGYPPISSTPYRPGFEIAGIVRAIGPGVTSWRVGDRVAAITLAGGGYASHLSIPAEIALPVPHSQD
jgi:NADPH2:quinone reductase